jgi:hypothetical protein
MPAFGRPQLARPQLARPIPHARSSHPARPHPHAAARTPNPACPHSACPHPARPQSHIHSPHTPEARPTAHARSLHGRRPPLRSFLPSLAHPDRAQDLRWWGPVAVGPQGRAGGIIGQLESRSGRGLDSGQNQEVKSAGLGSAPVPLPKRRQRGPQVGQRVDQPSGACRSTGAGRGGSGGAGRTAQPARADGSTRQSGRLNQAERTAQPGRANGSTRVGGEGGVAVRGGLSPLGALGPGRDRLRRRRSPGAPRSRTK